MIICIGDVLSAGDLEAVARAIPGLTWSDGRLTAGWAARDVKRNEQAGAGDAEAGALKTRLTESILASEMFQLAARPKALSPLLISRYRAGMTYGTHVDDALMQGMRTDISFTLFLSDPAGYDGGALIIESTGGEQDYKLPVGTLIAYPATSLHRVEPVTSGERIAAVGWVRSFVRRPDHRELLFDLETARRQIFDKDGKSPAFDLLSKCASNLLREWAED